MLSLLAGASVSLWKSWKKKWPRDGQTRADTESAMSDVWVLIGTDGDQEVSIRLISHGNKPWGILFKHGRPGEKGCVGSCPFKGNGSDTTREWTAELSPITLRPSIQCDPARCTIGTGIHGYITSGRWDPC